MRTLLLFSSSSCTPHLREKVYFQIQKQSRSNPNDKPPRCFHHSIRMRSSAVSVSDCSPLLTRSNDWSLLATTTTIVCVCTIALSVPAIVHILVPTSKHIRSHSCARKESTAVLFELSQKSSVIGLFCKMSAFSVVAGSIFILNCRSLACCYRGLGCIIACSASGACPGQDDCNYTWQRYCFDARRWCITLSSLLYICWFLEFYGAFNQFYSVTILGIIGMNIGALFVIVHTTLVIYHVCSPSSAIVHRALHFAY